MGGFTSLWVDDCRPIPESYGPEWCSARTGYEALLKLELIEFEVISLDHDLATRVGLKEINGFDILSWLVERKVSGLYVPQEIRVHSANPVGVQKMQETINRYW